MRVQTCMTRCRAEMQVVVDCWPEESTRSPKCVRGALVSSETAAGFLQYVWLSMFFGLLIVMFDVQAACFWAGFS